ncbi:hypothetical protein QG082_00805 [Kingella kingae]|uniref:hypothetical protein n=1 Tax=Kingella kingae TaxID=504 RepID=UPI00254A75A9|nr:hypothetical protein [Kingella kingae]MDK4528007.1 hypothetical protein [Kingella kingae]MDK4542407.1 hypothetical protein [Kingella kingae]MDK4561814.1 hypothetical protein [Kingella kingae]MDK4579632.1 hypothetical protein [Kingella kingae]MDK4601790.1 hypothetical protein [Kingella kingae]
MNNQTIQYKNYTIEIDRGTVADIQQNSQVEVSGSGSFGHVTVNSTTTQYTQFFLTDEQGTEKCFHLTNWSIPMRIGNEILVFSIVNQYGKSIIGLKNKTLTNADWNLENMKKFAKSQYSRYLLFAFMLFLSPILLFIFKFMIEWLFTTYIDIPTWLDTLFDNTVLFGCIGLVAFYQIQWRRLFHSMKNHLNNAMFA